MFISVLMPWLKVLTWENVDCICSLGEIARLLKFEEFYKIEISVTNGLFYYYTGSQQACIRIIWKAF